MSLQEWIDNNLLDVEFIEPNLLFNIDEVGTFLVIKPKSGLLFDDTFNIILDEVESELIGSVEFVCFQFGGKWYYSPSKGDIQLNILKYLGNAKNS